MSVFEEWGKPFPKIRPVSYYVEPCGYWDCIVIRCTDLKNMKDWVIELQSIGGHVLNKNTKRFMGTRNLHSWTPEQLENIYFSSVTTAGDFYQEHLNEINKDHHLHPDYEPVRYK